MNFKSSLHFVAFSLSSSDLFRRSMAGLDYDAKMDPRNKYGDDMLLVAKTIGNIGGDYTA